MSENNETGVMGGILKRAYSTVFYENWPLWLGGILIGIMSVLTFACAGPCGDTSGAIRPVSLFTFSANAEITDKS